MPPAKGYAAQSADTPLAPFSFERRDLRANDVRLDILYCGVCHSDLHTVRSEWPGTVYPCVPGHEIVGRVAAVGPDVTRFEEGDFAAIGCLVDSCFHCSSCAEGLEQYCEKRFVGTYNGADKVTARTPMAAMRIRSSSARSFALNVRTTRRTWRRPRPSRAGITTCRRCDRKVGRGRRWASSASADSAIGGSARQGMGAPCRRVHHVTGQGEDARQLGAEDVVVPGTRSR